MAQLSLVIVGADHPNKDKSNRRSEILWSSPGEEVNLIPEPKNPVDPQAVAVFSSRGIQIGYVRGRQSQLIRSYLAKGKITGAIFQDRHDEGAVIRLGLDGEIPILPELPPEAADDPAKASASTRESQADPDSGFYPDFIPPDD